MKQAHFYHYTYSERLRQIFRDVADGGGLRTKRRFVLYGQAAGLPDKAHDSALWGMLEPRPESYAQTFWTSEEQSFFEDCLIMAKGSIRPTVLLKAEVSPEDDIYIADWGVHLCDEFNGTAVSPPEVVQAVKTAYWESLVTFDEYMEGAYDYHLPEVICFNAIPQERLSIDLVIPGSEMDRYIKTGEFDPEALERDRENRRKQADRAMAWLKEAEI